MIHFSFLLLMEYCSLGSLCFSSQLLKGNGLKSCSYPFDWIFSSPSMVLECIEDDFRTFLDKSYYISRGPKQCGHSLYRVNMFNHHNPLKNSDDYSYYQRCVDRFRVLLASPDPKVFVLSRVNISPDLKDSYVKEILDFNNKFSKYTCNYKLLAIIHIPDASHTHHSRSVHGSVEILEFHSRFKCNGLDLIDCNDRSYLRSLLPHRI